MCLPTGNRMPMCSTTTALEKMPDFIPKDYLCTAAYVYAAEHLHPFIFNHSLRVYQYAHAIAQREGSKYLDEGRISLLFVACMLHDIGTTEKHDGPLRFEVEGADAAKLFLMERGTHPDKAHEVWIAIAIHTSQQIAERISPLARLVRLGVAVDFKREADMKYTTSEEIAKIEKEWPRGEIEKVLGDAVADQAVKQPGKAPKASWPGDLLRAKKENPEWDGVNKGF